MQIKIKRKILILLLSVMFLMSSTENASAQWGADFAVSAAEEIKREVISAITEGLKQAAIEMLNDTVDNAIAGVTQAGALFIIDWEDYLFSSPALETSIFMNDFFAISTRGKESSLNYRSDCGVNYTQWRNARAKGNAELVIDFSEWQSDFEDYACGAANMFANGTWEAMDALFDPNNNPLGYDLAAEGMKAKKKNQAEDAALAAGIAYQGFKATKGSDGETIITPGSITKDIKSNTLNISNMSLANADRPGEVAGAFVGKIVASVIRRGIGKMQQNIQEKINDKICEASQSLYDELGNLVPEQDSYGLGNLGRTGKKGRCMIR